MFYLYSVSVYSLPIYTIYNHEGPFCFVALLFLSSSRLCCSTAARCPFAASTEVPEGEAPPAPPPLVFEAGDLVGPIGGLLRRKKAYMAEHYGSSSDRKKAPSPSRVARVKALAFLGLSGKPRRSKKINQQPQCVLLKVLALSQPSVFFFLSLSLFPFSGRWEDHSRPSAMPVAPPRLRVVLPRPQRA